MFSPINKPEIVVAGLSLDLYDKVVENYMLRLSAQLEDFQKELEVFANIKESKLCFTDAHFSEIIKCAEKNKVDTIVLIPMSYTTSLMVIDTLLKTSIPVIIWNTQWLLEISSDYDFDDLLMNHVPQGTQDITNVLCKKEKIFAIESGYYKDEKTLNNLAQWLEAARTLTFSRKMRVGLLGQPFEGMGDFDVDLNSLRQDWGPQVVNINPADFANNLRQVTEKELNKKLEEYRMKFDLDSNIDSETLLLSVKYELALRMLFKEQNIDAFTMNFLNLIDYPEFEILPFFGINMLISEGLGYAGEGDIMTAAHMAQLRQLCGVSNFTEIYTVDYVKNRMLMTHMQECNPAMARKDRKISLVKKDFWAPGIKPYAGMHFTLEPGPVTISAVSFDQTGRFFYVTYETHIADIQPLEKFDIPHWLIQSDEPVREFLTKYSLSGGGHHLAAIPGHQNNLIEKLAHLQNFDCRKLLI